MRSPGAYSDAGLEMGVKAENDRDTVLVLTHADDGHSDLVIGELVKRAVSVIRFHTEDFPERATLACTMNDRGSRQILVCDGREHDLGRVRCVWNRRPRPPRVSRALSASDGAFASKECTHLLRALWALLGDRFWVNRPDASRQASLKPAQLLLARGLGFEVPRTLMTNRPELAVAFFAECGGEA